jgi:hypothetical protein
MSSSDLNALGYPRTDAKRDWEFRQYCGGSGAGGGVVQTGVPYYRMLVKNDRFSVNNRRTIIRNLSLVVYKQASWNGSYYDPVPGSEAPMQAWAFVDDLPYPDYLDPKYMHGGMALPAVPPYDFVFEGRKPGQPVTIGTLPQPGDPGYRDYTSVYLFWGDSNYWWQDTGGAGPLSDSLRVLKQDTDTRQ